MALRPDGRRLILSAVSFLCVAAFGQSTSSGSAPEQTKTVVASLFQRIGEGDRSALEALRRRTFASSEVVKQVYAHEGGREQLLKLIDDSRAIFVVGDMEDREAVIPVRRVLDAFLAQSPLPPHWDRTWWARNWQGQETGDRFHIFWDITGNRRLHEAALKVLFRLGEERAEATVRTALTCDEPTSRSIGIGCVLYAKRVAFVPLLIPLLDDPRDGPIEGPMRSIPRTYVPPDGDPMSYYRRIRVCDIAAHTIAELLGIERAEYKLSDNPRHEPAELDKLRALAMARLSARPASGEAKAP